ncbi:MAG TPA: response regulator [Planctomycetaceae bacterium]|nr:response regulator [Planctomycetaceae bacterium]
MPKILLFSRRLDRVSALVEQLGDQFDVVASESVEGGLQRLREGNFSGVFLCGEEASSASALVQGSGLLEQLFDAYALVDLDEHVVWGNSSLKRLAGTEAAIDGRKFFELFGSPKILGPDFEPFNTAMATNVTTRCTFLVGDIAYFELQVTPVFEQSADCPTALIAVARDVTAEVTERDRQKAIYQAGLELGDLTPQEILDMDLSQRKELLKSKIVHFTKDLLKFETVEIRLLDKKTKRMCSLLVYGMEQAAVERELFAEQSGNGVTGYVAATGNSYLCLDTANDPLYLVGNPTARSSLTVPLKRHEEILGTFNVESSRQEAFNEKDKEFLELFSREVAIALNTLELLVVQRSAAANESTSRILHRVAQPADDILIDASRLMERFIGMDPEAMASLQRILKHTRQIKQLIQEVGQEITPPGSLPDTGADPARPLLQGKRILVVDNDDSVREAGRALLGQFHCDVETSHCGQEAFSMVRAAHYDVALVDINLSDMTGFECFSQLRQIHEHLPIVLMTGFGYDPGHSIVKARQAGLKHALYKPFRMDLLLSTVEAALAPPTEVKLPIA